MKYYNGYFFNKRTLQEGYYYYIDSKIKNVKQENNTVTAEIIGDKTYHVKLEFKENEVKNGDCTCTKDSNCKHMAALFHFLNAEKSEKELNCLKQKLKPIIKKINKEELEDYLLKLLSTDDELLYKFNLKFHTYFSTPSLENYKKRIKAISAFEGIEKCHNKKYYSKKEYYFDNMSKLLLEVKELIKEKKYNLSFNIVCYILDNAPEKDHENLDKYDFEISNYCEEIIKIILKNIMKKDEALEKKILKYFLNIIEYKNENEYKERMYDLLYIFINKKMYIKEIEESLLKGLEEKYKTKELRYTEEYINMLIRIYKQSSNDDKIIPLLEKFSYARFIFDNLIKEYEKRNYIKEEIKALENKINDKRTYDFEKTDYAFKLSELYYKENILDKYKDLLYKIFFKLEKYDLETYKKIKKLYSPKEWEKEKISIIKKVEKDKRYSRYYLTDIYIEEKMYDKVLNRIKRELSIDTIKKYEKEMPSSYNDKLIDIYIDKCRKYIEKDDTTYYYLAGVFLVHIKEMKNGKEKYEKLYKELEKKYNKIPKHERDFQFWIRVGERKNKESEI